jgi:O-Antigen ligase/Virulence factor membrane-bound polymerase, C-terminal/Protein glycosylation ligase
MTPHIGFAAMALAAVATPALLAYNASPSTTFFNQALAAALWGSVASRLVLKAAAPSENHPGSLLAGRPAVAALALLALGAAMPWGAGGQALSMVTGAVSFCLAAIVLVHAGQLAGGRADAVSLGNSFFLAWVITGLLNVAVALIQVFSPAWPDGDWIAHSSVAGRAVGNLRQPNHLSSLLLWAAIALIGVVELRRLAKVHRSDGGPKRWSQTKEPFTTSATDAGVTTVRKAGTWLCMALFIWAIVLTASRTGLVGVALLAVWGLADRRLSPQSRWLLLATPLMYATAWWGMAWWADLSAQTFGGQQRLAEGDVSGSRFRIWADALYLITLHPWTGVGWGNFNFAWSLTPFPNRHTAFFDHTHNLPLQLAVELGVPMALLTCGLLLWALWQAWRRALAAEPAASAAGRCAVMMLVLIGLHSLLEYPLWYAYFLLPTAFIWGFALGLRPASQTSRGDTRQTDPTPATDETAAQRASSRATAAPPHNGAESTSQPIQRSWPLAAAGALCMAGAVFSVFDYLRVADIFAARPGAAPLEQRIEAGKRSVFFAHHAHYAAATVSDTPGQVIVSFDIASHHLLDTRLMMAWAKAFAEVGDLDRARHLAERLREFRNPDSANFFAECDKARAEGLAQSAWPFQCTPPSRTLTWQDFLPRAR